jgi:hypothetical protein
MVPKQIIPINFVEQVVHSSRTADTHTVCVFLLRVRCSLSQAYELIGLTPILHSPMDAKARHSMRVFLASAIPSKQNIWNSFLGECTLLIHDR